ncbi:hypothetical protein E4635_00280 [Flavobacterium humi]|uniref:Uncharacterized protein n=1 Tax=Flavobacterium humi TaxID=2562683 RepID=A0A4Z0LDF1_9FLAO|nr:hypothetical protein E4635_00280 [Flavobacterium humi]
MQLSCLRFAYRINPSHIFQRIKVLDLEDIFFQA